jgi:hypothetical protein
MGIATLALDTPDDVRHKYTFAAKQVIQLRVRDYWDPKGMNHYGVGYGPYHTVGIVRFLEALRKQVVPDTDILDNVSDTREYLKNYPSARLHCSVPGGGEYFDLPFCDMTPTYTPFGALYYLTQYYSLYAVNATQQEKEQARYGQLALKLAPSTNERWNKVWCEFFPIASFLWMNDDILLPSGGDPAEKGREFADIGWVSLRTGWGDDDMVVAARNSEWGGHVHLCNGNFVVGTKRRWLISDGGYKSGAYPCNQTKFHSVLLVDDSAQQYATGGIPGYYSSPKYGYFSTDASANYYTWDPLNPGVRLPQLSKWTRTGVLINDDKFLVLWDDIDVVGQATIDWLLRTPGEADDITFPGDLVSEDPDNPDNKLLVKILLPALPKINVLHDFVEYPILPGDPAEKEHITSVNPNISNASVEEARYLTVHVPYRYSSDLPDISHALVHPWYPMQGAVVGDNVVLFGLTNDIGEVKYTMPDNDLLFNVIVDLQADCKYHIFVWDSWPPWPYAEQTTTDQGTLDFWANGLGGSIISVGTPPIRMEPGQDSIVRHVSPAFEWEDTEADTYTLFYSPDSAFETYTEVTGIETPYYVIEEDTLANDVTLYWQVLAFKDSTVSTSNRCSFEWDLPTTYWIDDANGNDSWVGSKSQPWKTIQHAADVMGPWERVFVRAGNYSEQVVPANSGQPGDGIYYQSYPGDEAKAVVGDDNSNLFGFKLRKVSHIFVDGFEIRGQSIAAIDISSSEGVASSHNVVRNCNIVTGDVLSCVHIWGNTPCVGNTMENCSVDISATSSYVVNLTNAPNTRILTTDMEGGTYGCRIDHDCDSVQIEGSERTRQFTWPRTRTLL